MNQKNLDKLSVLVASAAVVLTVCVMSLTSRVEVSHNQEAADPGIFTEAETALISAQDSIFRVLLVTDHADSLVLRQKSQDLAPSELDGETFAALSAKMLATVQAPQYDGVGLAAPQVGILRRVIAVCRMDKQDSPFEVYADVRLDSLYGPVTHGPEGCLSIPGVRGNVPRYSSAIVSYTDVVSKKTKRDTVSGYPAIIFQHECDHLDGILYTDKADSLMAAVR